MSNSEINEQSLNNKSRTVFLKFIITGVVSNLINFFTYTLLYVFFGSILTASTFGYLAGLGYSYLLGRVWVFSSSMQMSGKEFLIFILVYAFGGVGMVIIIHFSEAIFRFDYRFCWLLGAVFAALNNFVGSKFLVFNAK